MVFFCEWETQHQLSKPLSGITTVFLRMLSKSSPSLPQYKNNQQTLPSFIGP